MVIVAARNQAMTARDASRTDKLGSRTPIVTRKRAMETANLSGFRAG